MFDNVHEQHGVQRSVRVAREKFSHIAKLCLRNAELMGELDLLRRCVDPLDAGIASAREKVQKCAMAAA